MTFSSPLAGVLVVASLLSLRFGFLSTYGRKMPDDKQHPEPVDFLKWEPKTASDDGWNARILGANKNRNPHMIWMKEWEEWRDGYEEADAVLGQEIG
jgi:hypothetical protein